MIAAAIHPEQESKVANSLDLIPRAYLTRLWRYESLTYENVMVLVAVIGTHALTKSCIQSIVVYAAVNGKKRKRWRRKHT